MAKEIHSDPDQGTVYGSASLTASNLTAGAAGVVVLPSTPVIAASVRISIEGTESLINGVDYSVAGQYLTLTDYQKSLLTPGLTIEWSYK